jgi:hypothetical protein
MLKSNSISSILFQKTVDGALADLLQQVRGSRFRLKPVYRDQIWHR